MGTTLKRRMVLVVAAAVLVGGVSAAVAQNRAQAVNSSMVIAVIGDYGCQSGSSCSNVSGQQETPVANLVHGWSPNAIITVGDNSYEHGCAGTGWSGATNVNCSTPTDDVSLDQAPYASDVTNRIFYEVPGNHDMENKANVINGASSLTDCISSSNCGYYYNRPSHYTAHLGNGLVDLFALDVRASDPDGTGASSAQATAYTNDYNASTAIWKIEAHHESNWSSGQHGSFAPDASPNAGQPTSWTIKSGIDLFLSGHDHDMEHLTCKWSSTAKDCSGTGSAQSFSVVGTAGKNLYGFAGHPRCPFTGQTGVENCAATTVWRDDVSPYHYGALKITITHATYDQLKAEYYAVDGTVLHRFSLYKSVSTGDVSGTITDSSTGNPIAGAKVDYGDGDVSTDASGNYTLPSIPIGSQTLTVSANGYQTSTLSVTVPATGQNKALAPALSLFSDGFEAGNFNAWTSHTTNATNVCSSGGATSCTPNLGTYAADFNPANTTGGTYLTKTFANNGTIDIRGYFNVASTTTNASLFYFQTASGGNMFHPYIDASTHKLGIRVDFGTPSTVVSCLVTPTPPWNAFHRIEAQVVVPPTGSSTITMWYDGTKVTWPNPSCPGADTTSQNVGNTNAGKAIVGDTASNRTFHYVVDDAAVDKSYIGSATRSITGTVTDAESGAALSGATVSLTGGGSATTDASGNYTLPNVEGNRNITLTASATHYQSSAVTVFMPFGDAGFTQGFVLTQTPGTISGTVRDNLTGTGLAGAQVVDDEGTATTASDGTYTLTNQPPGSHTVLVTLAGKTSASATVTVPQDGGSATQDFNLTADVYGDGFESGSYSAWTLNTNQAICTSAVTGCPHSGTYGSEANTTTGNSFLKKTGFTGANEEWARVYVYIKSQGANNASIVHFVNTSGAQIGHVYEDSAHKIGFKNDVSGAATLSTTTMTTGAWHSVELHLKIGSTTGVVDVYLDGTAIGSLSLTGQNLGSTNIGGVWVGDNQSGRTFDLLFDDVEVQDAYVGP